MAVRHHLGRLAHVQPKCRQLGHAVVSDWSWRRSSGARLAGLRRNQPVACRPWVAALVLAREAFRRARGDILAEGGAAAAIAQSLQPLVEEFGVGASLAPPFAQVGVIGSQGLGPSAGAVVNEQDIGAGGAGGPGTAGGRSSEVFSKKRRAVNVAATAAAAHSPRVAGRGRNINVA